MSKMISVDFQKEFVSSDGRWANPGKSVLFIMETLIPFCHEHHLRVFEIISDYRQPRPGDSYMNNKVNLGESRRLFESEAPDRYQEENDG